MNGQNGQRRVFLVHLGKLMSLISMVDIDTSPKY